MTISYPLLYDVSNIYQPSERRDPRKGRQKADPLPNLRRRLGEVVFLDTGSIVGFLILLILLALSAFFSSAETAFTTVNKVRIRTLAEGKDRRAQTVQKIFDRYSKMLSTILVGNNLVNISSSSLATTLAIHIWGSYAVGIMTGILTLFVLLLGEITPKTWAMYNSERISLIYAPVIYALMILFTPIIFLIDKLSGFIMLLFHIDTDGKASLMTERDLKTYVDVSHEDGAIETEEREMIYNVFDFSDSSARDIMIPKIDITMVSIDASYNELHNIFRQSMYTRIPVFENDTDNVVGIVNIKDFLFVPNKRAFQIRDILREAYYTYELKKTADLMMEMRKSSMNVAFVLDEYGACAGMITLEDLLEEIVGEIRDEYDGDEAELIKKVGARQYLVAGSMKLDDINDALDTSLDSEDYDSIGGILLGALDHLPQAGESVTTESGVSIRAQKVGQNRIEKVLLTLPEPEADVSKSGRTEGAAAVSSFDTQTPVLTPGRPADLSCLPEKEIRCYDLLDLLNVPYDQIHHEATATIESCADIEKLLQTNICKNLFLCNRQQTAFYLVLMPGDKRFQTKELSAQLGISRLSFASADMMEELLDVSPGSVTIMGLMNDHENKVRLVIDRDVLKQEYFACHPCVNTASLRLKTADLTEKLIPALKHEPAYVEL